MAKKTTLQSIADRYSDVQHNDDNYSIGGGLANLKFASNRHEDACNDEGKLTLGQATALFKKATGLDTDAVRNVLEHAIPTMEWHHAGKLPKAYGGGMKKTYFLKAHQISDVAKNWAAYCEKLLLKKAAEKNAADKEETLEARRNEFLKENAKRFDRVIRTPDHSVITLREMKGKYGWFESSAKSYNLTEYISGWVFETAGKKDDYLNIR